jgi:hypothetical protein
MINRVVDLIIIGWKKQIISYNSLVWPFRLVPTLIRKKPTGNNYGLHYLSCL